MAVLQRILRTALRPEKSLLLRTSRCISGLQSCQNPHSYPSITQDGSICSSFLKSSTSQLLGKTDRCMLLPKVDIVLPMSPAAQLIRFQLPTATEQVSFEMPTTKISLDNAHINQKVVEIKAPQRGRVIEQLAIRMLVVRRRKMRKHHRRKFLKKFRIKLITIYKKRESKKETAFLSGLENEFVVAETFSAEEYAAEKIRKAHEPLPVKEKLAKPLPWEFQPLFHNSQKKSGK